MAKKKKKARKAPSPILPVEDYSALLGGISDLLKSARHAAARSVNAVMTATYWEIGRRIVEQEQGGKRRAAYGKALIERLAEDLCQRFGRGFSERNPQYMRRFYETWSIPQTESAESGVGDAPVNRFSISTLSLEHNVSPFH